MMGSAVVAILACSLAHAAHGLDFKFESQTFRGKEVRLNSEKSLSVLYDMNEMKFRSNYSSIVSHYSFRSPLPDVVHEVYKHESGLLIDVRQKQLIMYQAYEKGLKQDGKDFNPTKEEGDPFPRSNTHSCFRVKLSNEIDHVRKCIEGKQATISSSVKAVEEGKRFEFEVNQRSAGKWQVDENSALKKVINMWDGKAILEDESSTGSAPKSEVFDAPKAWGVCDAWLALPNDKASQSRDQLERFLSEVFFPDAISECLGLPTGPPIVVV